MCGLRRFPSFKLFPLSYNPNTTRPKTHSAIGHKLPPNAPDTFKDRSVLWNGVELAEKSGNAQLAREIEIALPKELTLEQQIALTRVYIQQTFVAVECVLTLQSIIRLSQIQSTDPLTAREIPRTTRIK